MQLCLYERMSGINLWILFTSSRGTVAAERLVLMCQLEESNVSVAEAHLKTEATVQQTPALVFVYNNSSSSCFSSGWDLEGFTGPLASACAQRSSMWWWLPDEHIARVYLQLQRQNEGKRKVKSHSCRFMVPVTIHQAPARSSWATGLMFPNYVAISGNLPRKLLGNDQEYMDP